MSYKVAIRKNDTGEVRLYDVEWDWTRNDVSDGDYFWWTGGSYGCDCNRSWSFLRAGGPGPADDPHWNNFEPECGTGGYSALYAELPDGRRIVLDDPTGDAQ